MPYSNSANATSANATRYDETTIAGTNIASLQPRHFDFTRVIGLSNHALEVHRTLYHGYVQETNALLPLLYASEQPQETPTTQAQLLRDGLVRRFAFERNGVLLHELFFEALRGSTDLPRASGLFIEAVEASYGGFEPWKRDVIRLAQTRGIGWVLTVRSLHDNRLSNVWIDDHTRGLLADWTPIFALDLWEHAYLIDFKPSERPQYLQTVFDNIDWEVIEARCQ